jgi:hypothetical protein
MTKNLFVLFLLAFFALTTAAQQQVVEPGKPQELKGVTRIFISASDAVTRNDLVTEIKKRLPQVTITERSEDAEVWLLYSASQRALQKTNPASDLGGSRTSGTPIVEYSLVASGSVIKPVNKQSAHRLIEFKESAETLTPFSGQVLSSKFARAFIKSYQKANPKGNSGGGSSEPEVTVARY